MSDQKPITTPYDVFRPLARDGDVALFRSRTGLVRRFGGGPWTHAGLLHWSRSQVDDGEKTLMLVESLEWAGCREVAFLNRVRECPGRIDIARPKCAYRVSTRTVEIAERQTGHDYGWEVIWRMVASFFCRVFTGWAPDSREGSPSTWRSRKVCSQLCVWAARKAGKQYGFNPCPNLPDWLVKPSDMAHDSAYEILWRGLTPPKARAA